MNILPFTFVYPMALALAVIVLPLLWLRRRRQPAVGHSEVGLHKNLRRTPIIGWLPSILFAGMLLAMIGSIAKPVVPEQHEHRTMDTRDIVVAVDISGSMMSGSIPGGPPEDTTWKPENPGANYRPIDSAQDAVMKFVPSRKGDRVGLFLFDDQTYYAWPMTDDLRIVLRHAMRLHKYNGGGTNFEGPTESDPRVGPIHAAGEHFKDYGKARTKVLILVTDGEAPISDKRMEELTAMMEALGGKVYVLGIGSSWTQPGSPAGSMTAPIKALVERNKGKWFAVGDSKQMQEAMQAVDQLEKSQIQIEQLTTYRPIYHYFILAAIVQLVLFLGSVYLTREVPA